MTNTKSLKSGKTWLDCYLSGTISREIFKAIDVPGDDVWAKLMQTMQKVLNNEAEVNAENVFLYSKNMEVLAAYMQIVNFYDQEKVEKKVTLDYDISHPENIAAEAYRQLLLNLLEDIKKDHP